ncbi:hypothetical protein DKT69_35410, partial [Micromonospora sicca]
MAVWQSRPTPDRRHDRAGTVGQHGRVPAISLPPVPYDATAVRPAWAALPAGLRDAVAGRLGGPRPR